MILACVQADIGRFKALVGDWLKMYLLLRPNNWDRNIFKTHKRLEHMIQ